MKSIREMFGDCKSWPEVAEKAKNRLLANGYIYSPVYGWERPELIESFGLDPNAEAIPSEVKYDQERECYAKGANEKYLSFHRYKTMEDKRAYAQFKDLERLAVDN